MRADLEGKHFGLLKVIKYEGKSTYLCQCKCGNFKTVKSFNLTNGHTKSCGCLIKQQSAINGRKGLQDLTGMQFGQLKAIQYVPEMKKWECVCECGNITYVAQHNLTRKKNGIKSCGCLINLDKANQSNIVDGTNVGNIKRKEAMSNSKTGIKGVYYSQSQGLYIATIGFQGNQYTLARSANIDVCIAARKEAEHKIHDNFLEWYEIHKEYLKQKKE